MKVYPSMFEVTIDFHDFTTVKKVKRCASFSELALYLERIPNMFGFLANPKTTVEISAVAPDQPKLFDDPTYLNN